ncbi:MAG TPA: helix-turn-helix domain-containing protein [Microbacteriaceae bacterium]|nr:helix-turn-helix domain-containing protein [Microbacteriaceae bacterium]
MSGVFEEIRGSADDLDSWRVLITGGLPSFQRVENPAGGEFHGTLHRQILDRISAHLIDVRTSRHVVHRTAEHIRFTPEPLYVVNFQIAGTSTFTQAGSSAALRSGDYAVSSSQVPFDWEFDGDFTVFMLRFPQAYIEAPAQSFLPLLGRAIRPEDGFGAHLSPFVASVARDPDLLRGPVGRRVAQNLVDLFTTSFLDFLEQTRGDEASGTPVFQRVTAYIAEHLTEPDLGAASIAAANFVSTRSLQAIFQEHGTTISAWIRERRLAGVRRAIGDPVLAERSIGELAERWGFPDQAHFSRVFRQAFGESPKQWRARASRDDSGARERDLSWLLEIEPSTGWL